MTGDQSLIKIELGGINRVLQREDMPRIYEALSGLIADIEQEKEQQWWCITVSRSHLWEVLQRLEALGCRVDDF